MSSPVLTPARSGVYRTPVHIEAVRQAGGENDLWLDIDCTGVASKSELLDAFARDAAFAPGFGRNWDALADVLQDVSLQPAGACAIRLLGAGPAAKALGADWATFIEVLSQTAAYWKRRNIAFVAFADDASALPVWI